MKRRISLFNTTTAVFTGALLYAGAVFAQPTINGVYPDGAYLMQPAAALTFTAASTAGINPASISVDLTSTTLAGTVVVKSWTSASGLGITGNSTNWTVSLPLKSNLLYSASISVTDSNSSPANSSVSFSTLNNYTFEAEDYDYTNGLFFDSPQTNAYAGLSATDGTDFQHDPTSGPGSNVYRPRPGGLALEGCGDQQRSQYSTGQSDYDVGWNNGGDWAHYTRNFPAGTYNVYLRGADGNAPESDAASLSIAAGNATLSGAGSLHFAVPGGGWQTYHWCPLVDGGGNLATLTCDGTTSTLQVTVDNGNFNANFYMLVPVDTNVVPSTITISNIYPDGQSLFQSSSTLSFTLNSPDPIDPSGITVRLTGTNLWGHGSAPVLTVANGLTVTGPSTNLTVTAALATNTVYNVAIIATDASGNAATTNVAFDTIIPAYTFEAEDYDYNGGLFIDNPQTNAYANLDGLEGIDTHTGNPLDGAWTYRNQVYLSGGIETESCGDKARAQYAGGLQDYDCGFANGGNWANYTRTYPAGAYNIYLRAANGNGLQSDSASVSLITGGQGTTNQTMVKLGTFGVPNSGGWQTYAWVPLRDAKGNLVQFMGGAVKTLRVTTDAGSYNANFYLLSPADPNVKPLPSADNVQPDGSSMFQYTNVFSFLAHSSPGIQTSNISVTLNGVKVNPSKLSFTGAPNLWTVSCPVDYNGYYTAVITLADANGTSVLTNTFATFSSTNYQWEAEDYDYNGGQYFDNPQVDSYLGLNCATGIDCYVSDPNANSRGYTYRPQAAFGFPDTTSGDQARDQFTSVSATDYSIGSFGGTSWANYTRNYPAGTYNVIGRFAEGASASQAMFSKVASGYGTSTQTIQSYGTFNVPLGGWSTWEWAPLVDSQGKLVKITLDGSLATLQLDGPGNNNLPEVNVNFFMLVPTMADVWLTATVSGGNVHISFPTQTGHNYQLQYKNNLTDASWTNVGSAIPGNNQVQSASDSETGTQKVYRVQIQ